MLNEMQLRKKFGNFSGTFLPSPNQNGFLRFANAASRSQ
jgi:hypothetical protein